jgi:hypothetical protein
VVALLGGGADLRRFAFGRLAVDAEVGHMGEAGVGVKVRVRVGVKVRVKVGVRRDDGLAADRRQDRA